MAIVSFKDEATRDIAFGTLTKKALKCLPLSLHHKARVKLKKLDTIEVLEELFQSAGNRLERLIGDRRGQYSLRINIQYRICFIWKDCNAYNVEIVDYH